jgi:DNA polymerase elongation subunit (family B)
MRSPKILILDIETAPNIGFFWKCGYNLTITHDQIITERRIISVAYKWYGQKETKVLDWGWDKQCDKSLLKEIQKLISEADAVIGQNHDDFDLTWIQGRLMMHKLPPLPPKGVLVTLDTLKLSRASFNLNSNKLDYLSRIMNLGGKHSMKFQDWVDIVLKKDKKAFIKMLKYNIKDVQDTEKVFERIKPYVKLPVHFGVLLGSARSDCPNCGSNICAKDGTRTMRSGIRYQRYLCKGCFTKFKGEKLDD